MPQSFLSDVVLMKFWVSHNFHPLVFYFLEACL